MSIESQKHAPSYAELSRDMPPSADVVAVVELVTEKGRALDLGAGSLRNTRFLLEHGFQVDAVDRDPILTEVANELGNPKLAAQVTDFSSHTYPTQAYDLIVAHNTLPFATAEEFPMLWNQIVAALKPGGVFCGTFFGPRDTWATTKPWMLFHPEAEVRELLRDLEILTFKEREADQSDIQGNPKHWHVFEATARKVY